MKNLALLIPSITLRPAARAFILTGSFIVLLLLVPMRGEGYGTPIALTVDPAIVDQPRIQGPVKFDFSFGDQLDGLALNGQTVPLDFMFADGILARVLGGTEDFATSLDLDISLSIQTNATTFPGFAGEETTGFVLGADRNPLHAPLDPDRVGRTASRAGRFSAGLFPTIRNFDMSGVHYDLVLPDTGYAVTGGSIRLSVDRNFSLRFGTPFQLPDDGVSLAALALMWGAVVVGTLAVRRRQLGSTISG
jgi:hypothetical protein